MATANDNSILCSNSTATLFRLWATFIHNAFLLGFVSTSDTGQVDLTTVSAPSSANQSMGYKIYKTNDGLTDVYFKVEFGSGANGPAYPGIWITASTSSNGAGTLNGTILLARTALGCGANDTSTTNVCVASGANNRITFAMFLSLSNAPLWFSAERRKDTSIADTNTGMLFDYGLAVSAHGSLCAPFSGTIPSPEKGMQFILTSNNPGIYASTVPEGLRIPCLGPSEPPGRNIAVCNSNDYAAFATPTLTINTTSHTFKHCGPNIHSLRSSGSATTDSSVRLLLRYE